jgi:hypothetical protein
MGRRPQPRLTHCAECGVRLRDPGQAQNRDHTSKVRATPRLCHKDYRRQRQGEPVDVAYQRERLGLEALDDATEVVEWGEIEQSAALLAAEWVPSSDLREALETLGLLNSSGERTNLTHRLNTSIYGGGPPAA